MLLIRSALSDQMRRTKQEPRKELKTAEHASLFLTNQAQFQTPASNETQDQRPRELQVVFASS